MPGEPATLKEALDSSDAEEWKKAMESELKSIEENGTWELVELPEGRKAITSKWLFKIKSDANGNIERYKSRLVAKGYQQKEKVDYKEMFAPVVKPRTLLAGATIKVWVVKQMDVTTAFLNGVLEEEIFMAQPEGFDDGSGRVLKLKKALYGQKQAPRQWYLKLRGVLEEICFTPSTVDHSLFMLGEGEQRSFMVVYVDDILIFSPSSDLVKEVMLKLQDKFKCKALGDVSFYLGLHIERDVEKRCMCVHQRKYLEALAANFGQSEGHLATPFPSGFKCVKGPEEESVGEEERRRFHSLVGSLMYAAVTPDRTSPYCDFNKFLGKEFTDFVDGKGIVLNLTCPYTPQQNSMAEREMRIAVESVRTMLFHMAPLGAVLTMAGPEERGGRGAGGSGEAQAQGQPRDSAMAPMQPSLGPPRDEPRVFGLDKFNGDNFAEWSFKMENIFDHYDLLKVMEGMEKRPENDPEKSPWVQKSAQGYLLLGQALGSSQIRHIKPFQREPEKGPKAWAALKGVHAPATAAVAVVLERQMAALRIEEDEAVEEGVQKFFDLLTRLEGADLNYSELQKKTKLLALLPESWSSLIINLNRDLPRLWLEDQASAVDMAVEGAEDEEEEGLEAATTTEAAGVADTAMTTRTTDAVADGLTARVIFATRADTCGAIVTNSLTDGLLLKDKRVEEQEEGDEEDVKVVAVAEVVLQV
ncbi:unnamed protein product [Closterium sp. NIES-54]